MFSAHREDVSRQCSLIKSNLLNTSVVDVDTAFKCVGAGTKQNTKGLPKYKNRRSNGYFPNKYRQVQPATRIKFNHLSQKTILIPTSVQIQTHIVNVSFGLSNRRRSKPRIPSSSQDRPVTCSLLKRVDRRGQASLRGSIGMHEYSRDKSFSPTKVSLQSVQFKNQHLVSLNKQKGKASTCANQPQRGLIQKQSVDYARCSAPLQKKVCLTAQEVFFRRRIANRKDHFVFSLDQKRGAGQNRIQLYRDFLWKVNFSNDLYVESGPQLKKHYTVYVGTGNNSTLIKCLMKRRFWWTIVDKMGVDVNFVWTQLKMVPVYTSQLQKNVQDMHDTTSLAKSSITSVDVIALSLKQEKHCSNNHQKILNSRDSQLWTNHYSKNTKTEETLNEKTYYKRIALLRKKGIVDVEKPFELTVHNHFQTNYYIGNKKALFYAMRLYYNLTGEDIEKSLPLTFHIRKGLDDSEFKRFLEIYKELQKEKCKVGSRNTKNIWIIKPGEFTNRGKGITVCSNLDDIVVRLKGKQKNDDNSTRTFIIQKYIQRPFLYHKRKFDIRHYMMITCINKKFKGYWYQQGYIRTTSSEYNIKNCKDNFVHLTNDAVQKNCDTYGKFQKGNKLSYQEFQKYLDTFYSQQKYNLSDQVLSRMKTIATDSIRASYSLLDVQKLEHNFEVFGLDFMIDDNFDTYLIEINTNPCLELSSPLLSKLIPTMISNALMIGLDPLFPPPYDWPSTKKYQLCDNPLDNNKFQLIFDETIDGPQLVSMYSNIKKIDQQMGNIEEEEEEYPEAENQFNEQPI